MLSRPLAILVGRLVIGRDELRPNEVVIGGEAPHPDFRTAAHEPDFHHSRSRRGAIHCAQMMVRETSDHARLRRGDRSTSAVSLRLRFGAMPVGYCALRSSLACAAMSARRRRVNTSLRRHTQALLFHGPRVPPNTSFGLGWQAKAVTTAGAKWSGWRGLCRGWAVGVRRHLAFVRRRSRSISKTAAFQPIPHGETLGTEGAGGRNERTRRMAVALGAAHLGGTPHGGGMRGREERPDAQPVTVQGRGCSWRVATTVDVASPWSPPASRSKSEARMGHP